MGLNCPLFYKLYVMEKQDFSEYISNIRWRYNTNVDDEFARNVIRDLETGDYWKCAVWFDLFGCVRTIGLNIKSYCRLTHFVDNLEPYDMITNDVGWIMQSGKEFLETTFEWERKLKKISARIHIMKSPNGLYVGGKSYSYSIGSSYCGPSIWDEPFKSQEECFQYVKDDLYRQLKGLGEGSDSETERKEINKMLNILLNLKWDRWSDKPLPDNTTTAPPKTNYLSVPIDDKESQKQSEQLSLF